MGRLFSILGKMGTGGDELEGGIAAGDDGINGVLNTVNTYAKWSCVIVLSICSLLVGLYAVYLGFKMAKAADDGARKEAKQHVIYAIIGLVAIVAVAGLIGTVMTYKFGKSYKVEISGEGSETINETTDKVMDAIRSVVQAVLSILSTLATLFAVYVGWKFMSASDDQKRKDAKMQLMYTVIAIVAMVLVNVIAGAIVSSMMEKVDPTVLLPIRY